MLIQFFVEEEGQSLVEYGMLISLIALVAVAAVTLFGGKVVAMWSDNNNRFPGLPAP